MKVDVKPSDLYETPPEVFQILSLAFGPFDTDLCAEEKTAKCKKFFTPAYDALKRPWLGRCWLNPPYSNPKPWVEKAIEESALRGAYIVALLPGDTSTRWFQLIKSCPHAMALTPPGRVRFLYEGVRQPTPKFGSIVAVFHAPINFGGRRAR